MRQGGWSARARRRTARRFHARCAGRPVTCSARSGRGAYQHRGSAAAGRRLRSAITADRTRARVAAPPLLLPSDGESGSAVSPAAVQLRGSRPDRVPPVGLDPVRPALGDPSDGATTSQATPIEGQQPVQVITAAGLIAGPQQPPVREPPDQAADRLLVVENPVHGRDLLTGQQDPDPRDRVFLDVSIPRDGS